MNDNIFEHPCFQKGCPEVLMCLSAIERFEQGANEITEQAASDEVEDFASSVFSMIKEQVPEAAGIIDPSTGRLIEGSEDIAAVVRQMGADMANHFDDHIAEEQQIITDLTKDCPSPLTMRAKRNGRVVTVRLCDSPAKFFTEGDGVDHEQVHVTRKSTPKVDGTY